MDVLQTRLVCPFHRLAYSQAKMLLVQLGKPSAFRCCRLGFCFRTAPDIQSCLSLHGCNNKVESLLTGALPVWIQPECDSALGIAVSTTAEALEAAFAEAASRQLKVGAVLVVSPTYFGTCSDIAGLLFTSRSPVVCPSVGCSATCASAISSIALQRCSAPLHQDHPLTSELSRSMFGIQP